MLQRNSVLLLATLLASVALPSASWAGTESLECLFAGASSLTKVGYRLLLILLVWAAFGGVFVLGALGLLLWIEAGEHEPQPPLPPGGAERWADVLPAVLVFVGILTVGISSGI